MEVEAPTSFPTDEEGGFSTSQLLTDFRDTLLVITNGDRDSATRGKTEIANAKAAMELYRRGRAEDVNKIRKELGPQNHAPFVPKVAENFQPEESIAGVIIVEQGQKLVRRKLLGRECVGVGDQGEVKVIEYFQPLRTGDSDLFSVAREHLGLTGREGRVSRSIPRHDASDLVFSGTVSAILRPQHKSS